MDSNIIPMDSARQHGQQSRSSGTLTTTNGQSLSPWADPNLALKPVTKTEFRDALAPCLALVGGVGMNTEARKEWLIAAYTALCHFPADLIERGAREAMRTADHPSKIVPAIVQEVGAAYASRKRSQYGDGKLCPPVDDRPAPEPYVSKEEAAAIMAEFGLKSEPKAYEKRHLGPPRHPTPEELEEVRKSLGW